jgi:hypothetical protein
VLSSIKAKDKVSNTKKTLAAAKAIVILSKVILVQT